MNKVVLCIVLISALMAPISGEARSDQDQKKLYRVVDVLSGDRFLVESGAVIHYASIAAPPMLSSSKDIEDMALEAKAYHHNLVVGKEVYLEWDSQIRNEQGDYLAYVYLSDGTLLNEEILRSGYAKLSIQSPNFQHADELRKSARAARIRKEGLWVKEEGRVTNIAYAGDISTRKFHYPDCELIEHIPDAHLRIFTSTTEARSEKYRFCNVCKSSDSQITDLY